MGQKKITWAIGLAMVLMLSACGQQSNPAASALDTSSTLTDTTTDLSADTTSDSTDVASDSSTVSDTTATDSVDATPAPPVLDPSPSPSPSTLPSIAPTPAPVLGEAIVQNVAKSYPGILVWEKCRITFQLRNPFWLRTLKERMVVTFTHKGAVVETKEVQIQLSPANIANYDFTSTQHADDASVATYAY